MCDIHEGLQVMVLPGDTPAAHFPTPVIQEFTSCVSHDCSPVLFEGDPMGLLPINPTLSCVQFAPYLLPQLQTCLVCR
jgi:hypothetical protein